MNFKEVLGNKQVFRTRLATAFARQVWYIIRYNGNTTVVARTIHSCSKSKEKE